MKKVVLIAAFFAGTCAVKAQNVQNAIKINPLSLILATGNVSYERAVSDAQTFQLGVYYTGVKVSDLKYSGFGITPEYRFYVGGKREALNGVYVAPFVRYQNFTLTEKNSSSKASFNSFGGGGVIGWERTAPSGFVIDLFVGPQFNSGTVKVKDEGTSEDSFDVSAGFDGFGVRVGITIGFGF